MLGFTADHNFIITVIKMIIIIVIVMVIIIIIIIITIIIIIIIIIKIMLLITVENKLCYLLFRYLNDYPVKQLLFVVLSAEGYTERNFQQPLLESVEDYMTYLRFFLPVIRASTSQA